MALTAKPISTISYNTHDFLKRKLDALMNADAIDDYRFIHHDGENGDKDHFHVFIQPNRRLDTVTLRKEFNEADPSHPNAPLGCMPFRQSKADHWIMYVIHDPEYLRNHDSEGEDGKKEYELMDIETPFFEQLVRDYRKAVNLRETLNQKLIKRIQAHESFTQILNEVPNVNPVALSSIMRNVKEEEERREIEEELKRRRQTDDAMKRLGITKVTEVKDLQPTKAERWKGLKQSMVTEKELNNETGEYEVKNQYLEEDEVLIANGILKEEQ